MSLSLLVARQWTGFKIFYCSNIVLGTQSSVIEVSQKLSPKVVSRSERFSSDLRVALFKATFICVHHRWFSTDLLSWLKGLCLKLLLIALNIHKWFYVSIARIALCSLKNSSSTSQNVSSQKNRPNRSVRVLFKTCLRQVNASIAVTAKNGRETRSKPEESAQRRMLTNISIN